MPRITEDTPDALKPYEFHGIELSWRSGQKDAVGDCMFCGREGKFNVLVQTGQFRCVVCEEKGNAHVFLQKLWEISERRTESYADLVESRRLLDESPLIHWEVVKSALTGDWLIPGYSADGRMTQLYKYAYSPREERYFLWPTPTMDHQLFGVSAFDAKKEVIDFCEGPWDGLTLWELFSQVKESGGEFVTTANPKLSLLRDRNVLATPTCSVFKESWLKLFDGKVVNLWYDNDHPRENSKTGQTVPPAGYAGMLRHADLIVREASPREVNILRWGEGGYDPSLPSGYDLRDALSGTLQERLEAWKGLSARMVPFVPPDGSGGSSEAPGGDRGLRCEPCSSYRTLVSAWRKAMKWTDGLDHALAVMLASIASTKSVGDQLWVKVIGPAACGKSTLCEAVSIAREYVLAKSTIRGFHSGFRITGGEDEDHSLLDKLNGKTLVTKDGDALLQSPNLGQILSEARDVYDGAARTHYRNATSRDREGLRITWILCGTSSLRTIDSSELGERFLDCVIMEDIDDDLEDEIIWRVVNKADRNLIVESDGKPETHQDPDLTCAMQLTGGYVNYLRLNALDLLSQVDAGDEDKRKITRLGKFVAYMRARPSVRQEETAEREFSARLVSQLWRLTKCLAVVLNKKAVDDEVLDRVTRVALDTARGQTLEIVRHLYEADEGLETRSISLLVGRTEDKVRTMLRFLGRIGAVEPFQVKQTGLSRSPRWRLTPKLRRLYDDVVGKS